MKKLKISYRLAISMLFFVVPLGVLLHLYIESIQRPMRATILEEQGDAYQRPAMALLTTALEHRQAAAQASLGDVAAKQRLVSLAQEVDKALAGLRDVQVRYGEALQFTREGLSSRGRENLAYITMETKWKSLAERAAYVPFGELAEEYKSFIADIRGVIVHLGDTSGLILDPDLDSYYLMDVTLIALPQAIDRGASIATNYSAQMTSVGDLPQPVRIDLARQAAMMEEADRLRIEADFDTAYKEDGNFYGISGSFKPKTGEKLTAYREASIRFEQMLRSMSDSGRPVPLKDFIAVRDAWLQAAYGLWNASVDELNILLQIREGSFKAEMDKGLIGFAISMAVAALFFFYVARSITRPLGNLQKTMLQLVEGNLETEVPCQDFTDEIGSMARTVQIFKETSLKAREMAERERLDIETKRARQERSEQMIRAFDSKVKQLLRQTGEAMGAIGNAAQEMTGASGTTRQASGATEKAVFETAGIVSSVATAAEELTAAIREINMQVTNSSRVTAEAVERTKAADEVALQLDTSAKRIGEVVNLISDIAEQINLLALNATIESARAGEAGKGFAVVASEVKSLAAQTGKATTTIAEQISEVQTVVGRVVKSLHDIRGAIEQINGISTIIAAAVEEQGAATTEIARNIQTASQRVQEVSTNMSQVSALSEQTNNSATGLIGNVTLATRQSSELQEGIEGFLNEIARA